MPTISLPSLTILFFTLSTFIYGQPIPPANMTNLTFTLTTSSPSFITSPTFVSMCYDISQLRGSDPFNFFNTSRIVTLLQGLTPVLFRLSGTDIDTLIFNATGECNNGATPYCLNTTQLTLILNLVNASGVKLLLGVNGLHGKNNSHPNSPWDSSNAQELFTWLNNYIETNQILPPYGYELGNEPDLWHNAGIAVNGSTLFYDSQSFLQLVSSFPSLRYPNSTGPNLFGPDTCNCFHGDTILYDYMTTLANMTTNPFPSSYNSFTYHYYAQGGRNLLPYKMLDIEVADSIVANIGEYWQNQEKITKLYPNSIVNSIPITIGETGECVMGGCLGVENNVTKQHPYYSTSFIDGFLFLDKLGQATALNISNIMREKVFGGNDGFINANLIPEASYWPMLTYSQLMGSKVLNVLNSTTSGRMIRIYAHCTRQLTETSLHHLVPTYPAGSVTLMFINFYNYTYAKINLVDSSNANINVLPRDEYIFSGAMPQDMPGNDTNCVWDSNSLDYSYLPSPICLSKQLLYLSTNTSVSPSPNNTLPMLPYNRITNSDTTETTLTIPPLSYGFMVLSNAQANACMET